MPSGPVEFPGRIVVVVVNLCPGQSDRVNVCGSSVKVMGAPKVHVQVLGSQGAGGDGVWLSKVCR